MPEQTLQNKIALVSGSSAGIGAAIAAELASRGANVVVNYPFAELRDGAEKLAASFPTKSIAIEADLSTVDGPQKLADAVAKQFGRIDILVNNAGLVVDKPIEEHTLADWDLLVNLNGRGTFLLMQATLPHLPKEGGRIVNISSAVALDPPPGHTVYAGTKGMVSGFTRVWAKELPPKYGVTVNAVCPGPTGTDTFLSTGEDYLESIAPLLAMTPVAKRLGKPEEIAAAVGFLCEPRAGWINGVLLPVNGGISIV